MHDLRPATHPGETLFSRGAWYPDWRLSNDPFRGDRCSVIAVGRGDLAITNAGFIGGYREGASAVCHGTIPATGAGTRPGTRHGHLPGVGPERPILLTAMAAVGLTLIDDRREFVTEGTPEPGTASSSRWHGAAWAYDQFIAEVGSPGREDQWRVRV